MKRWGEDEPVKLQAYRVWVSGERELVPKWIGGHYLIAVDARTGWKHMFGPMRYVDETRSAVEYGQVASVAPGYELPAHPRK